MLRKVIIGTLTLTMSFPVMAHAIVPRFTYSGDCLAAPSLSSAHKVELSSTPGVTINTYDFNQGVSHAGEEATRVSIAGGSLDTLDLQVARGDYPSLLRPWDVVDQLHPYAEVNAGFFDLFTDPFSWGPVIRNSKVEYFPLANTDTGYRPYWLGVVGVTQHAVTTGGYGANGSLVSPWFTVATSGVNLQTVPAQSAIIYDSTFTGSTPQAAATVVIRNGVVTARYLAGRTIAVPSDGYVIQANGTYATRLRKFEVSPTAVIAIPDAETSGFTSTKSSAKIGKISLAINAVNLAGVQGATLFTGKWKTKATGRSMTLVITKNKVSAVHLPGKSVKPSATSQVLQISNPTAALRKTKVGAAVTLTIKTPTRALGYTTSGSLTSSGISFSIAAINRALSGSSGALAFDASWNKPTPTGAVTIVVKKGVVTAVYPEGSARKPLKDETVIQVPEGLADNARRLATVTTVTVNKGESNKIERTVQTGALKMTGSLKSGAVTIPIAAVNFRLIADGTATAYDNNWIGPNADKVTFRANATVVVRNGKITYLSNRGSWYQISNPDDQVIQVRGDLASQVANLHVGDDATVDLSYTAKRNGDLKFFNAVGRGATNLRAGENVSPCSGATDAVRPRTALGWNATGKFWLITTTPQVDTPTGRNGYRTGGSTVHQVGDWLKQLGATDAVSFDGGGSTAMLRYDSTGVHRVDMSDPNFEGQPWIRDIPIMLLMTDYLPPA